MKNNVFSNSTGIACLALLAISACSPGTLPGNTIGVPVGSGSQKASISGSVVKTNLTPAENATLVLIQRIGQEDRDVKIVRSDNRGEYRFNDVIAGEYRLAYVLQSESERKDPKSPAKRYDPEKDPPTGQYFSFISTDNFIFNGNANSSIQVPQINIGWNTSLVPNHVTVANNQAITFSWGSAVGALFYSLDIRDSNNNAFYKSPEISGNSFNWGDLTGNQGSNKGVKLHSGVYYYLVNARLSNTTGSTSQPTPHAGGTALAQFTVP
ncbi:hypothetical protein COW36_03095 [bacterium (Candidatus Blackallbacteria) CG17_big_fil_post_rev_8_21_14_2_50_48_46]|uniref:SD-repeat containing protein B domain-containing protein n=1 Tax=bacterium (Candidatus Blackallbacteria) CG17_big_fil_post_rev_8_21_14_2_50_48_46 TaxID=2014261 RepID=A0A2M7G9Y1_9BACT|nr:MAG: hypothetical protein COW64_24505 [bacterium (Candidatus Blackallbacteria) CG18_big_fil_WC_8_21_14_2_50_49_26]PIW18880.1 MAG: hypothetical protein COW36_03095 [bacterium (Candidatus Blackallbacteria) CG17_big_fil_post_rev_8_21_14_2_50_48_46]PIW49962.1 MAG: hypothetical protein COW20_04065 [bacterium (Candidatus Blackallbacteria) CG13_big_fil_rev_8_21_14_2_50_49_14]